MMRVLFSEVRVGDKFLIPCNDFMSAPVFDRQVATKAGINGFVIDGDNQGIFTGMFWGCDSDAEVGVYSAKETKKTTKSKVKNRKRS